MRGVQDSRRACASSATRASRPQASSRPVPSVSQRIITALGHLWEKSHLACVALACALIIGAGVGIDALMTHGRIHQGVSIGDIDVSGMTVDEAAEAVQARYGMHLAATTAFIFDSQETADSADIDQLMDEMDAVAEQISVSEAQANRTMWMANAQTLDAVMPSHQLATDAFEVGREGGIFGAEPCSENMRAEIASKLGIQYCDVYGLSEIMGPGVAMECKERGGLHIAEDQFLCEIIDPDTGEALPDGEWGELVITTLTRECSPMIRYRTRDVTRIISDACACGRTHRKIDRLRGRTDDMLIIRGVNVFPSQIEQVITGFPEIASQYQIVLTREGALDAVALHVETEPDFPIDEVRVLEDLKRRLQAELKSNLQVNVDVKIVEPKTIERSMGKAKRVIDLREAE